MSASPPKPPSGPNSASPSSRVIYRKKPPTNIFQPKKKPIPKPAPGQGTQRLPPQDNTTAPPPAPPPKTANGTSQNNATAAKEDYNEYPIYVSKSSLEQGLRYNAFRLHSKPGPGGKPVEVNPYDEKQFTRPIHLYRRYAGDKLEQPEQSDVASGVDDKERELQATRRLERQAEKEANQALIAPTGEAAKNPAAKRKKLQKKVEDVYFDENNKKHVARAQLRYEEARPWHLEDFDNKMRFVGSYEQPLAKSSVMFVIGSEGFKMIPVEKWYKMTPISKIERTMTSEQIEQSMSQKYAPPRWFMGSQSAGTEQRRQMKQEQQTQSRKRKTEDDDDDDYRASAVKREEYQADVDEIDFEFNDEFQDDDEGFMYGDPGDDEAKEIEKRIREEMRTANLPATGVKNEDMDWDEEEKREKEARREEKRKQKKQRKLLKKKERRIEYESDDSDDNKYESSSEDEDSEEERERLEEERKEEAKKAAASQQNGDKSGASTKGTNTPSGRSEKKPGLSLKRDAELSELSGNESSRKKARGSNGRAMSPTGRDDVRSLSPDTAKRVRSGYGSGSDTDTSRAGRSKTALKLKNGPPRSPKDIVRTGNPSVTRAETPDHMFPTLDEVTAAIPAEGIPIRELVDLFRGRVSGKERSAQFIQLVKEAGHHNGATKRIMRKAK
ncbi:Hypothetical protein R9X50_00487500 [Acrodontium crateriforme]|uniref:Transcription initiation factor IIF subunit alpha n=1 Tax=Acrodontium crateriforme TaxID=150365 RepID=A0AAQ3M8M4_9PEZI|nr:Hypothetical protein R9X50_00487500 [Acrodontium crateriforme]